LAASGCGGIAASPRSGQEQEQAPSAQPPSGQVPGGQAGPGMSAELENHIATPDENPPVDLPDRVPGPAAEDPSPGCGTRTDTTLVVTRQEELAALSGCEEFQGLLVVAPRAGVALDLRPLASLRVIAELMIGCIPLFSGES